MRLLDLVEQDLHHALDMLKADARNLELSNAITLVDGWENELPRVIHRYEKEMRTAYNSFDDPLEGDEEEWVQAHRDVTLDFLVRFGLAEKNDNV